jgi:hypothetical protein
MGGGFLFFVSGSTEDLDRFQEAVARTWVLPGARAVRRTGSRYVAESRAYPCQQGTPLDITKVGRDKGRYSHAKDKLRGMGAEKDAGGGNWCGVDGTWSFVFDP